MGAMALMLRELGYEVRGSDAAPYPPMSDRLAAAGVEVYRGYAAENLAWGPDAVVVGNVIRPDSPEIARVRELGIGGASMAEALAEIFIPGRVSVVVSGTHGKTTTSSMAAWIAHEAGLDPSFFIGGLVAPWNANYRVGGADGDAPIIIEGDEYDTAFFDKDSKFHHYRPFIAAINNIEFDHADIFADLDAIVDTFSRFTARVPADGLLVRPISDVNAAQAIATSGTAATVWRTSVEGSDEAAAQAEVRATEVVLGPDGCSFQLHLPEAETVGVHLKAAGLHNIRNALVAAALTSRLGVAPTAIASALGSFTLPLRRLTLKHLVRDIPIIDDFAHHPTAIAATIAALRAGHPGRRIVTLFEVQSNTARRKVFQEAFGHALATADRVWFCRPLVKTSDPLPPANRLDLTALAAQMEAAGVPATIIEDTAALATAVAADAQPGKDVIVAMSGRHFDAICDQIAHKLNT